MTEEITLESLAGVGPVTTRKLNDAGIHNIMDLVVRGPVEIAELTSMDIDTAVSYTHLTLPTIYSV